MALHFAVLRFEVIVFREIILIVLPALKEIQISAAGFRALIWWKLLRILYKISTASMNHSK